METTRPILDRPLRVIAYTNRLFLLQMRFICGGLECCHLAER
jgi:hypothetical protein